MLPEQVGGSLSGNHYGGNLVISEKDKTYQCTGAHCIETCNINLYRVNRLQQSTCKYYSSVLLDKIESSSQSRTATSNQGNMGLFVSRSISSKVDWQSRNGKDLSDRKLNPNIFSPIGKIKEYLK